MNSVYSMAGIAFGGLGLFLLGMWLMTEGLKMSGGHSLQKLLGTWTNTGLRGFFSGVGITAVMQSSSGVTVATIGFVNAGLLTMNQALWVVFGSNVGTTMTGWLVAIIGFNFKIDVFALPMIGIGAMLHLFAPRQRYRAFGSALAGFGILFLGIETLKDAFVSLGESFDIVNFASPGIWGVLSMVLIGIVLTTVMQSSSAAIALVLTAVGGGLMSLVPAAAMVIGANIGTTSTAVFSSLGATSNARRVAAAHVIFNLLTGIVALLLLPLLIKLIEEVKIAGYQLDRPEISLALFHTVFNLLGVLLMVPLAKYLEKFLLTRFRTAEEDMSRLRYLDNATATVPDLAMNSLTLEISRLGSMVTDIVKDVINLETDSRDIHRHMSAADSLAAAITSYIAQLHRNPLTEELSEANVLFLRIIEYYRGIIHLNRLISEMQIEVLETADEYLDEKLNSWMAKIIELASVTNPAEMKAGMDIQTLESLLDVVEKDAYDPLKNQILSAGAKGRITLKEMETRLELISLLRRIARQLTKAARVMNKFIQQLAERRPEKQDDLLVKESA